MSLKIAFVVAACLAVLAQGDQAPVYPEPPQYGPPPAYPAPQETYPDIPPKYTYKYGVADGYSGASYDHAESRDGYKTEGSYTVDLPDGRKQIYTYIDNGDGLEAVVSYEGEAKYPEPVYPAPAPYA